jgi:hypothetical protein
MNDLLLRGGTFVGLALLTIVLAYLYQRHERVQSVERIWVWPLVYSVVAVCAIARWMPLDSRVGMWLAIALAIGLVLGTARGFRPTLLSGAIFITALLFNESEHVFPWGDPNLPAITLSLMVLTAGSSIGANVSRVIHRRQGPPF